MRRGTWIAAAIGLLAVLLGAGPAFAATTAPPAGLSISIKTDGGSLRSGDHVTYIATVQNDGIAAVDGRLVVTVPNYLSIVAADGGHLEGSDASWTVELPVGASVTKKVSATLGDIPKGELRVTTLVSLYLGDATQPAIRSAEADAIAGVTDPAHAVGDEAASPDGSDPSALVWIGIGVAVVVVAVVALGMWWFIRRRRLRTAQVPPPH